jgi:hypothetical protein
MKKKKKEYTVYAHNARAPTERVRRSEARR